MRISVIGTGSIGRRHIGNFLSVGSEVTAFDDPARATHPPDASGRPLRRVAAGGLDHAAAW
jgi:3-hydroxyisobutyrate dehydrogenase-like beta-hydroxyacid dehydrogenase